MSTSRATRWWCSPAYPAPANRRWPSARCTPRRSGAIWNRCRRMRTAVPPDGGAGGAEHRRLAAGGGVAAAARRAQHPLVGRQRQHALEFAAHAVLARRRLPGRPGAAVRRIVFTQYAAGRVPPLPRPGTRLRRDRALDGARRYADHPRARRGGVADRVAWPEPARHPRHARLRRRYAVARTAEEG